MTNINTRYSIKNYTKVFVWRWLLTCRWQWGIGQSKPDVAWKYIAHKGHVEVSAWTDNRAVAGGTFPDAKDRVDFWRSWNFDRYIQYYFTRQFISAAILIHML